MQSILLGTMAKGVAVRASAEGGMMCRQYGCSHISNMPVRLNTGLGEWPYVRIPNPPSDAFSYIGGIDHHSGVEVNCRIT